MILIYFILLIYNLDGQKCTCERITDETTCNNLKCNWTNDKQCKSYINQTNTEQLNASSTNSSLTNILNFCDTKCNQRQQCTSSCELLVGCNFYNGSSIQDCNQINQRCAYNGSGCIEKQDCSLYDLQYCTGQNNSNNQPCSKNYNSTQCIIKTCQSQQFQMCQVDSCANILNQNECTFSKDLYGNCTWINEHCSVVFCQQDFFIDKQGVAYQNNIRCNLQACENYTPGDLLGCDQLFDYQGYQCENQNIYNCQRKQCINYLKGENCPDYCQTYQSQCIDISIINCELLQQVDCNVQNQYCIYKDKTCQQIQCSDFSINNCTNFNKQCVWNGNQCTLINDRYCQEYDLQICGSYQQYDGKLCKIENNVCVPVQTTASVQLKQTCELQFSEEQCYLTQFFLPCIWFQNRCLSIQFCQDIPDPSLVQCQKFSKNCGYKEDQCANLQSCSNYSKQDCYIGIDGPCSVNQMGNCQIFQQCSDIQSSDNQVCQQWNQNCISDGQKCIQKSQACSIYISSNTCFNDNRCYVYDEKCTEKKCQVMNSQECLDNKSINCYQVSETECGEILFCSQFKNEKYCKHAGQDGTCYYTGEQCNKQTACFQQNDKTKCLSEDGCKFLEQKCQDLQCKDTAKTFFSIQFGWQYCNGTQQFQPQSVEECILESNWNEIYINGTCISCDYIQQRPIILEGQPLQTRRIDSSSEMFHLFIFFIFY